MKNIYLIRTVYTFIILVIVCVLVAINNYFFYKNEEKSTIREMRYEVMQLQGLIQECDLGGSACDRLIKAFINNSSIKGKVFLTLDSKPYYLRNLEGYKDSRKATSYSQTIPHKGHVNRTGFVGESIF